MSAAHGWTRVETDDGSIYYQNISLNKTSWERPVSVPDSVNIPFFKTGTGKACGWTRVKTLDGSFYYQHRELNQTTWDRPQDVPQDVTIPFYAKVYEGEIIEDGAGDGVSDASKSTHGTANTTEMSDSKQIKTPWVKVLAVQTNEYYYMNRKTKVTTWERPETGGLAIPLWQTNYKEPVPVALAAAPRIDLKLAWSGKGSMPSQITYNNKRRPEFQSCADLLPLWQKVSENGEVFYRNKTTNETAWTIPQGENSCTTGEDNALSRLAAFGVDLSFDHTRSNSLHSDVFERDDVLEKSFSNALTCIALTSELAEKERSEFVAKGTCEDAAFCRLAALLELLNHPPFHDSWRKLDTATTMNLVKTVICYLKGTRASSDIRSISAQILMHFQKRVQGEAHTFGHILVNTLGADRVWAHCLLGLQEATFSYAEQVRAMNKGDGTSDSNDAHKQRNEFHDASVLSFLHLVRLLAATRTSDSSNEFKVPPPDLTNALISYLADSSEEVFPAIAACIVDISHILRVDQFHDHVIDALGRSQEARHLSEGLVHLLNEHHSPCKDESFLRKIVKLLNDIFVNATTADFFYTNDLKVIVDIILRECEDLSNESVIYSEYLQLLHQLMRRSPWKTRGGKYRNDDIRKLLLTCIKGTNETKAKALAKKILDNFEIFAN